MLELRDLCKSYRLGDGEPIRALDGVSLTLAPGEFAALYGPSGSGKTTLLELVAAIREPDSGTVLVEGRDVFAMSSAQRDFYRLHRLGIVGHPEQMIAGARAIENASLKLLLTNTRTAHSTIEPLLERLGLAERLYHRTEQLSMGERQRVMIARALALDPPLVLADEPTGSLDVGRSDEILGLLAEICAERGASVLLATHDPRALSFAHTAYELYDGSLRSYTPMRGPREESL